MVTDMNVGTYFNALNERHKGVIRNLIETFFDDEDEDEEFDSDDLAAIRAGLEDIKAGRVRSSSEIDWDNVGV